MTSTDRNAAIWFSVDGFDPAAKGVNGRRMAGESFLKGWIRHADVAELVSLTFSTPERDRFARLARDWGGTRPVRGVSIDTPDRIAPVGTVFYSAPNFAVEAWRRSRFGGAAWSICGLTHTMSTQAVIQSVYDLRCAPSHAWDAVICTSRSVHAAVQFLLDQADDYLARRFDGARLPARFQTPIVPLGVACDEFTPDPAAGQALRQRLGVSPGDVVALIVARLSPYEKFDPLPVYIALAEAQKGLGADSRLHLLLYGNYPNDYARGIFEKGAAALMPDVGFHVLPHDGAAARLAALSASDLFLFPIDNLQESFGIAPVEAMAAGLPVVASDWDGIRDTVDGEAGIRVPTLGGRAEHGQLLAHRLHGGMDNYSQYLAQNSAMTRVDVRAMAAAILALAGDRDRRARMSAAAVARARQLFDWSVVIPQMQDLFAELAAIRSKAEGEGLAAIPVTRSPVAPAPMALFAAFPTAQIAPDDRRWKTVAPEGRPDISQTLRLRDYASSRRLFDTEANVLKLAAALAACGAQGAKVSELAATTGFSAPQVERILLWLAKYLFAEEVP